VVVALGEPGMPVDLLGLRGHRGQRQAEAVRQQPLAADDPASLLALSWVAS
jgi:hypothetical protein